MSLADRCKRILERTRGIPGEKGLRPYSVSLRTVTWSGERVGDGTSTTVNTPLRVAGGTQNPKVRQLTGKDVVASGGLYTTQDLQVGPLTPPIDGKGTPYISLDPAADASPRSVYFVVIGPDTPATGTLYERIGGDVSSALHWTLVIRSVGAA